MNRSAGAPFSICRASAALEPYAITGLAGYEEATSSNASLRLAAASTVGACACEAEVATAKSNPARKWRARQEPIRYILQTISDLAQLAAQRVQVGGGGPHRRGLHAAIPLQHFGSERGQHRAAALRAALGRVHYWRGEIVVHRLDQAPRARIAHLH